MNNKMQLPIKSFEKYEETLENSNFHPVKILICHTGENLNGSVFSLDSINLLIHYPIFLYSALLKLMKMETKTLPDTK